MNSGGGDAPPDVAWSAQIPLAPGENALEIVAEGALTGERASAPITITAYFPCRKLAGRVATADGVALAGVAIALSDGRPPVTALSDADGRFVLEASGSFPAEIAPSLPRVAFAPSARRVPPGGDDVSDLDFVGDHDGLPAWSARFDAGQVVDAIPLDGAGALVVFHAITGGDGYYFDVQGGWTELDGFGRALRSFHVANGMTSILGATGAFVRAAGALDDGTPVIAGNRIDAQGKSWLWAEARDQPEGGSWGAMPKGGFNVVVRDVVRAAGGGIWIVGADQFGDFFVRTRPPSYPWFGSFDDVSGLVLADGASGVYVTGSYGSTSPRMLIVRQDGDGRVAWSRAYGPGVPRAVVADAGGAAVAADEPEGPRLLAVDSAGRVRFSRAWSLAGASVRALSAAPDGYRLFLKRSDDVLVLLTIDASGTLTSAARTPLPKQARVRGASDGSAIAWASTGVWRLDARGEAASCGGGPLTMPPSRTASSEAVDESVTSPGGGFLPEPVGIAMSPADAGTTEPAACSP